MRRNWDRKEFLICLATYLKLPFYEGRVPTISEVTTLIPRNYSSVSIRIANFVACDPAAKARGVYGMTGGYDVCKPYWDEFCNNHEKLLEEVVNYLDNNNIAKGKFPIEQNSSVYLSEPRFAKFELILLLYLLIKRIPCDKGSHIFDFFLLFFNYKEEEVEFALNKFRKLISSNISNPTEDILNPTEDTFNQVWLDYKSNRSSIIYSARLFWDYILTKSVDAFPEKQFVSKHIISGKLESIESDEDIKSLINHLLEKNLSSMNIMSECMKKFGEKYSHMTLKDWKFIISDYVEQLKNNVAKTVIKSSVLESNDNTSRKSYHHGVGSLEEENYRADISLNECNDIAQVIQIAVYTQKTIAVYTDLTVFIEKFTKLGGTFYSKLQKDQSGWLFSRDKLESVKLAIVNSGYQVRGKFSSNETNRSHIVKTNQEGKIKTSILSMKSVDVLKRTTEELKLLTGEPKILNFNTFTLKDFGDRGIFKFSNAILKIILVKGVIENSGIKRDAYYMQDTISNVVVSFGSITTARQRIDSAIKRAYKYKGSSSEQKTSIPKYVPRVQSSVPKCNYDNFVTFLSKIKSSQGNYYSDSSINVYTSNVRSNYIIKKVLRHNPSGDIFDITDIETAKLLLSDIEFDYRNSKAGSANVAVVSLYVRFLEEFVFCDKTDYIQEHISTTNLSINKEGSKVRPIDEKSNEKNYIRVTYLDGTIDEQLKVVDTLINFIQRVGVTNVHKLHIKYYGGDLVCPKEGFVPKYATRYRYISNNLFINTNTNTQTKFSQMKEIAKLLNYNCRIELMNGYTIVDSYNNL